MIGATGAAALLLSIGLLCARRIDTAVWLCALQAVLAAMLLGEVSVALALLAFALNGVALPVAIARTNSAALLTLRGNALVSWAGATVLLLAAVAGMTKVGTGGMVAAGTSVALLGLLLVDCALTRSGAGARSAVVAERPGPGCGRPSRRVAAGGIGGRRATGSRAGACRPLAAAVTRAIPVAVVALPFVTAAVLAAVASWRIGTWINAGSASLQFVVACLLVSRADAAETHLVLLTAFVAMTTSWFGRRDIAAALAARSLGRRRARLYHVGYQALIGAVQAATLAGDPILTWLALIVAVAAAATMTGAARGPAAATAASRLVLYGAIGLLLALLGTLLLDLAPDPASVFLLLGYGALAGLVPLHSWLANASAEGVAPAARSSSRCWRTCR